MITQQMLRDRFDYADGKFTWRINFCRARPGDVAQGSICKDGYARIKIAQKTMLMHRAVFLYHNGYIPKYIDHIDGNRANNRIENLRPATQAQNNMNSRTRIDNRSSGRRGVTKHQRSGKWRVRCYIDGKEKSFGIYEDIELAELVAEEVRSLYYNEFARL